MQVLGAHELRDDESERDALLGLRPEHVERQLEVFRLDVLLLAQFGDRPLAQPCASLSTSDFGTANVARCRKPDSACALTAASTLRFSSSLRFASTSRRRSSTVPLAMPNALANSPSSAGTSGASTALAVSVNCASLPATSRP